jgi:hypothetical protein
MVQLPVLPVALDVPLGQTSIKISEAEQPALCPAVLHLVCFGARLLGAIKPVLRIELAGHLMPYTFQFEPAYASARSLCALPSGHLDLWV